MATWAIRAVVLVAFLDLFIQLPVISAYAKSLGAAASMGGAIVGMYSASNLAGNVGAGLLLDRLNRKRLIAVGMILTSVALYLYDFVSTPEQLLALRAFHGLVAGVLAPGAFAMLGDRMTLHHTRSIGMSGALIAVSAVIGPPLAGFIRDLWGFGAVFTTSGTLMLAGRGGVLDIGAFHTNAGNRLPGCGREALPHPDVAGVDPGLLRRAGDDVRNRLADKSPPDSA